MVARVALQGLGLLGIAALALMPRAGFSQSDSLRARGAEQERVLEEIVATQANEGLRSPSQIPLLTELALLYEEEGAHALANVALEEARNVVRANYGLYTLDQLPLLQQALKNEQALGNLAMVEALEEELLVLAERHPDDLRTVSVHRDAGNRRMDILRRLRAGEAPPEVYPEVGLYAFLKNDVISALVSDAQSHYASAAAVVLRNELYSSGELRDLEMEIVRGSNWVRQRPRPRANADSVAWSRDDVVRNPLLEARTGMLSHLAGFVAANDVDRRLRSDGVTSRYELGRESYRRLIAYDERAYGESADTASLRSRVGTYVALADWDLLYSENGLALEQYERVHELLESTDFAAPLITELFAPPIPVVLPTFVPNPLETQESGLFIDVTFEVTKFGESRRVDVVHAAPNVSDAAVSELLGLVKSSRFRPRVTGGELGRASPVSLRYYLND